MVHRSRSAAGNSLAFDQVQNMNQTTSTTIVSQMRLAITYGVLAVLATAVNILTQDAFLHWYGGQFAVALSVASGTLTGLIVKYVLDKRFIFRFRARGLRHDGATFILYTAMGLLTTVIFWGFEFGFHCVFESREMRYLGAIIGLMIGYLIKYQLDKRYVFRIGQ